MSFLSHLKQNHKHTQGWTAVPTKEMHAAVTSILAQEFDNHHPEHLKPEEFER